MLLFIHSHFQFYLCNLARSSSSSFARACLSPKSRCSKWSLLCARRHAWESNPGAVVRVVLSARRQGGARGTSTSAGSGARRQRSGELVRMSTIEASLLPVHAAIAVIITINNYPKQHREITRCQIRQ